MEPIFAESTSETVTTKLRTQLDAAIAALPPATASARKEIGSLSLEKQLLYRFKTRLSAKDLPWSPSLPRHIKDELSAYT